MVSRLTHISHSSGVAEDQRDWRSAAASGSVSLPFAKTLFPLSHTPVRLNWFLSFILSLFNLDPD